MAPLLTAFITVAVVALGSEETLREILRVVSEGAGEVLTLIAAVV
jgi:hypothetical protein